MEPLNYGNVELSAAEKKAILLPPKQTVFDKISKEQLEVAAEVLANKIRWELRARDQREGAEWTEEHEWELVKEKMVFDEPNKSMNFAKQRVTDMESCRRINTPDPGKERDEIVIANLKSRFVSAGMDYVKQNCDKKGNIIEQNIDKETSDGIKSLKERSDKNEIIVVPTDKSGRLAVNTIENYVESMEPHIANDKIITIEDKKATEDILNGHSIQFGRILEVGAIHKHEGRVESALRNKSCHVPVLFGLERTTK